MNAVTRQELAQIEAPTVTFKLDGREVTCQANQTIIEVADREGVEIPRLCYKPGLDNVGNCRSCMVEIKGERVLAPSCCRNPTSGMEVSSKSERAVASQKMVLELLLADMPEADYTRHNEVDEWSAQPGRRQAALRRARAGRRRPVASGHRRQPRRLHPMHAVPARLPRRAGQRRDRPGLPRRARQDRVRHGRPDGRVHLRGLRRMRAGLPHRRADAGARRCAGGARQAGRLRLPVLRRRLPAHLQRQGQQDPLRRGPRRPGQPRAAVRQGPLRLRLRAPPAAPDQAADPPRRRAQAGGRRAWTRIA